MWVELEMQPVSKSSLLYVSVSEDILMKISRNLIWVSSLWTPVLYRIQALKLPHCHWESMSNLTHRIQFLPLSPTDISSFYRHWKKLESFKCPLPCYIWFVKVLKMVRWKGQMDKLTEGLYKTCFLKNQALKKTYEKRKGFVVTPLSPERCSALPARLQGTRVKLWDSSRWWREKKRADEEESVEVTIKQLAGNHSPPPESTQVFRVLPSAALGWSRSLSS